MHGGIISTLQKVLHEAGVPTSATLTEARGLHGRENKTRPSEIVVLDYYAPEHHLLLDGVDTTAYRNTRQQRETGEIPGYATKLVEDGKLYADKTLERPVAMMHGGGDTSWYSLRLRMVAALERMHKHSYARLLSGLFDRGGGAQEPCPITRPLLERPP